MVADAVEVEPVSLNKFPANREKNREFYQIRALGAILKADTRANSEACSEQGIILAEQGISARDQGILSARIEIIAERDVRNKTRLAVDVRFTPNSGYSVALIGCLLCQKQTLRQAYAMSALPPKADIMS
jgi:hypothetical protein